MFQDTLKFDEGRYQVTWPWREENPDLPVKSRISHGSVTIVGVKIEKTNLM